MTSPATTASATNVRHKPTTGYARLIKRKRQEVVLALAKRLGKVDDLKRKGVLE